jgi:single-strand DNA-binding protein
MLNTIIIQGRIVRDPELRRTGNGIAVASFTVAVDRDFAQDGNKETDFIDCVAWRQTGEFVSKYFRKGSMIVVKGRLQIRNWNDKDGNKRKTAEVVADNCYFGSTKSESDGGSNNASGYSGNNSLDSNNNNSYSNNGNRYGGYDGGYSGNDYAAPQYGGNYAVIEDEDDQLPFTV